MRDILLGRTTPCLQALTMGHVVAWWWLRLSRGHGWYPACMPDAVASNIIVFGRGLVAENGSFALTQASAERVDALLAYVKQNVDVFKLCHAKVVFSGGWAAAADGIEKPPARFREGTLMLARARESHIMGESIDSYADAFLEIESESTLENVLLTRDAGCFAGILFNASNPLGLVAHADHMIRIDYLVRKIFGLPPRAIRHIAVPGGDGSSGGISERMILSITRLALLGASSDKAMRRRHRYLVVSRDLLNSHRFRRR